MSQSGALNLNRPGSSPHVLTGKVPTHRLTRTHSVFCHPTLIRARQTHESISRQVIILYFYCFCVQISFPAFHPSRRNESSHAQMLHRTAEFVSPKRSRTRSAAFGKLAVCRCHLFIPPPWISPPPPALKSQSPLCGSQTNQGGGARWGSAVKSRRQRKMRLQPVAFLLRTNRKDFDLCHLFILNTQFVAPP